MTNNNYRRGPYNTYLFLFCSGGVPSNRITPEFSKWASDGELASFYGVLFFFSTVGKPGDIRQFENWHFQV